MATVEHDDDECQPIVAVRRTDHHNGSALRTVRSSTGDISGADNFRDYFHRRSAGQWCAGRRVRPASSHAECAEYVSCIFCL